VLVERAAGYSLAGGEATADLSARTADRGRHAQAGEDFNRRGLL
jgi:hypothetical protein